MHGPSGGKLALMNGQTNGPCPNWTFNANTNRISTAGFTYDAAGNLTADGTHSYQWDGEGRLVTVDNGATIVLVYNALGQQVGVTKGGTDVVWHLKSPADKSQGDYAPSYVGWNPAGVFFLGEKRVGFDVNGGIVFLHQNHLNSVTVPTTFDGSLFDDILYYPWGQYWEGEGFVFAGMDHYWEDVLHNTPNRQYAFYEGRWLSHDSHGRALDCVVSERVNEKPCLESSVPHNQQKHGSRNRTPVGGSHGKQVVRTCFEGPRLLRPRTADLQKTQVCPTRSACHGRRISHFGPTRGQLVADGINSLFGGSSMRNIICLVLATMLFATTTLEAKAGAAGAVPPGQAGTERKLTLKERILEVPPGTTIEVRLLNKQKIRGRLGDLTNEGFSLTTAQGEKIETQKVSFTDLKSFKKVEGGKAGKTLLYALAAGGVFLVVLFIWALIAHPGD